MKIFVAGHVPRTNLDDGDRARLEKVYASLEERAHAQRHKIQTPREERDLEFMSSGQREAEFHRRIREADSVITILLWPSEPVMGEAHFAAENQKPLEILVDRIRQTEIVSMLNRSPLLQRVRTRLLDEVSLDQVITTLEAAVVEEEEPPSQQLYL